jgi:hypothetical protein
MCPKIGREVLFFHSRAQSTILGPKNNISEILCPKKMNEKD